MIWVPVAVTVKVPVASEPAEKIASSRPSTQLPVTASPSGPVDQLASAQLPLGVAPPAPTVALSMSQ
jgi:hypothetical protein